MMLNSSVSLAPDKNQKPAMPSKVVCTKSRPSTTSLPPLTQRVPLMELSMLRPKTSDDGRLLPDGGRGSPIKGSAFISQYLPPPTFAVVENHEFTRRHKDQLSVVFEGTSHEVSRQSQKLECISPASEASLMEDSDGAVDTGGKPAHSYASLIGMAIMRAPARRLTLSAIYAWISSTFSYYSASESGWQNSIRHNLSLNKAFKKVERPKDEPGKGHYWTIESGCEAQFVKGKVPKKSSPLLPVDHSTHVKKDTKRRRRESDEPLSAKRANIATPRSSGLCLDRYEPASPPPTEPRSKLQPKHISDVIHDPTESSSLRGKVQTHNFYQDCSDSTDFRKDISYSANALDLVLSPPQSSSPARHDRFFYPRTPAVPAKRISAASPSTSLREHRLQMLQMLTSPDTELLPLDHDDDPWLIKTPKPISKSTSMLDSPWDEVAERAAFGSPDKRESRRRESRRSLVCGLHAQELYEVGFESSAIPGVNVLDIMKRELERTKGTARRPSLMERSQSSLF